tara:strand:- start:3268 stop:3732 length:465 start_codon:yes stop_codon:yes gene_type:complete
MVIKIISIGNKLNSWESKSIEYYKKQLPRNVNINFINMKTNQNPKFSKSDILKKESEMILTKIIREEYIISWDSKGDQINSEQFSNLIENYQRINKTICFIIGGSFGLSRKIKGLSNKVLSLSSMTFPHKIFKLLLVEQIYRAYSIINKTPYHK